MRRLISSVLVLVSLGFFTLVAAQLPPAVTADAYLLQVEQALRDGDHTRAWARAQDLLRLQREHDLDLPELHFWYAKAADSVDLPEQALESVVRYLATAGRAGQHYVEALTLMNTVQAAVSCQGWNTGAYFETATLDQVAACLDAGVDVAARNDSGFAPLHAAAAHTANPAMIEALLNAGADLEARDNALGSTPLGLAVRNNGNLAVIEVLLTAGADPETQDNGGLSSLHLAAEHTDSPAMIGVLIKAGAGSKRPEQVLETVEQYIDVLLEAGADPTNVEQALNSVMRDLAAAGLDAANLQASVRCPGWNTDGYFETATLEQVTACLETGAVDLDALNASGHHAPAFGSREQRQSRGD